MHVESHDVVDRLPRLRRTVLRGLVTLADAISIGLEGIRVALRESTGIEPTPAQLRSTLSALGVAVIGLFAIGPGLVVGALPATTADVLEAALRAGVLLVYLVVVSRAEGARRLFAFHGAEHKVIAAFESSGVVPTIERARRFSPVHRRCGTSFIAMFVIVAGAVHAFVPRDPVWLGASWRALLLPVDAALAYEVMRASARSGSLLSRLVSLPGRALQRITTREPTDDQLDVARTALAALLAG